MSSEPTKFITAAVGAVALLATGVTIGYTVGRASIKPVIEIVHPHPVTPEWIHHPLSSADKEIEDLLNELRPRPENVRVSISAQARYHLWCRADHSSFSYELFTKPISSPPIILNSPDAIFGGIASTNGIEQYVFFRIKSK